MATNIFRGILLASLATTIGCGNDYSPSKQEEITIAGRSVRVIPYIESGWFSESRGYILCELPGLDDCYSVSAYKDKLGEEVDKALRK